MALPKPHPGLVIAYDYQWCQPGHAAQPPAALVLAVADQAGERLVTAAPITTDSPADPRDAIELPRATCRRLGLGVGLKGALGDSDTASDARCFVIVSEVNRFVWPGPDLRPVATRSASAFVYGVLPPRLFKRITAQLIGRWHARDPE
ncbi:MAG: hypothetical protein SGJ07_08235 [Rhodospirillaceae bacterium]|nr:hypothetical protein [Rhodospirillaceae bacterium]